MVIAECANEALLLIGGQCQGNCAYGEMENGQCPTEFDHSLMDEQIGSDNECTGLFEVVTYDMIKEIYVCHTNILPLLWNCQVGQFNIENFFESEETTIMSCDACHANSLRMVDYYFHRGESSVCVSMEQCSENNGNDDSFTNLTYYRGTCMCEDKDMSPTQEGCIYTLKTPCAFGTIPFGEGCIEIDLCPGMYLADDNHTLCHCQSGFKKDELTPTCSPIEYQPQSGRVLAQLPNDKVFDLTGEIRDRCTTLDSCESCF
jgi:hypothetical protein